MKRKGYSFPNVEKQFEFGSDSPTISVYLAYFRSRLVKTHIWKMYISQRKTLDPWIHILVARVIWYFTNYHGYLISRSCKIEKMFLHTWPHSPLIFWSHILQCLGYNSHTEGSFYLGEIHTTSQKLDTILKPQGCNDLVIRLSHKGYHVDLI